MSGVRSYLGAAARQQRVAVARALVMRPRLVLADEPTGNLDRTTGAEILGLLRHMVESLGLSIVMVTLSTQAAAAVDRVLVIRDGVLAEDQAASSARSDPRSAGA